MHSMLIITITIAACLSIILAPPPMNYQKMPLQAYLSIAKAGDVILFRDEQASSTMHLTLVPFTHVGVVASNRSFLEIHMEGTAGNEEGIHLYNLQDRLQKTSNRLFVSVLQGPTISNSTIENMGLPPVGYNNTYIRDGILCKLTGSRQKAGEMQCAEFAAYVLHKAGVLKSVSQCLRPDDVTRQQKMPGYTYDELIEIVK
jgi:hypothetical protein